MDYVKKIDELNLSGNLAENWRIFWQNFKIFATAIELDGKSEPVKVAIFLNAIGAEGVEVFNSLNIDDADRSKFQKVTEAFANFCKPKCNEVYESYVFHNRCQERGEPFDNFLIDIKKMVRRCGFENENRMLRDRIVLGTVDKQLQKKLLDTADLTMDKAIEYARSAEISSQQMVKLTGGEMEVNVIRKDYKNYREQVSQKSTGDLKQSGSNHYHCSYCGRNHIRGKCPAYGKVCNKCKRKNHFADVCKSRTVNEVKLDSGTSESSIYLDSISNDNNDKTWYQTLKIENEKIKFKLDTGASVNVLPLTFLQNMKNFDILKSPSKLFAYNGTEIMNLGVVSVSCNIGNKEHILDFYVVDDNTNCIPILGLKSCVSLGLLKRVLSVNNMTQEMLKSKYEQIFNGLGCFKQDFKIELKDNAIPVSKPARRIPLSVREPLREEINRLCEKNIIDKREECSHSRED